MSPPRRAFKRRRWGWRRIHKWIGVSGGVLLLIWIITGIFISLPGGGRARLQAEAPPPDFGTIEISPAEAVVAVSRQGPSAEDVRSLQLEFFGSRPVYLIRTGPRELWRIDATTGASFEIDAREAMRIAGESYDGPGSASEATLVDSRELRYFTGPLPAFRVEFDDRFNTEIYIAVDTGEVMWWDGKSRLRRWMAALHDLWPIGPALGPQPRVVAMAGGGVLALAITMTGYWLAWRRGGWRLPKRRPAPARTPAS